jgi:hypothetical protein
MSIEVSQLKNGSSRPWHVFCCFGLFTYILVLALIPLTALAFRDAGRQTMAPLMRVLPSNQFSATFFALPDSRLRSNPLYPPVASSGDGAKIQSGSGSFLVRQALKIGNAPAFERIISLSKNVDFNPWSLAAFVLLLVSAALLLTGSPKSRLERLACLVALLASFPAQYSLRTGADSTILLPLVAAYWLLLHKEKLAMASICAATIGLVRFEYLPFVLLPGLQVFRHAHSFWPVIPSPAVPRAF